MISFKPEKNAITILRILIMVISVILVILIKIYIPFSMAVIISGVAVCMIDIFIIFFYMPMYFSRLSYEMNDEKITKHSGVFLKSHQSVRYSTVQYTAVITTPFSKYTGLNFVILFVYGGSLRLMFLSHDNAMEILRRCGDVS